MHDHGSSCLQPQENAQVQNPQVHDCDGTVAQGGRGFFTMSFFSLQLQLMGDLSIEK